MEFNAYFLKAMCALGAGLCMGIGAIGPEELLQPPLRHW